MRRAAAAALAALAVAGCGGGPPGDLFVVERTGSVPGADLRLRLTDDGGAYCNDLGRREITSEQLLEGRHLRRELDGDQDEDDGLATRGVTLRPGPRTIFSFKVTSEDGSVSFSDASPQPPEAFPRIVKLTRDVAREACGLQR